MLTELQAQQAKTQAAQAEKEQFMKRITELENQVLPNMSNVSVYTACSHFKLLTGGSDVKESNEFHKALELVNIVILEICAIQKVL